jgi:hypothetical protein
MCDHCSFQAASHRKGRHETTKQLFDIVAVQRITFHSIQPCSLRSDPGYRCDPYQPIHLYCQITHLKGYVDRVPEAQVEHRQAWLTLHGAVSRQAASYIPRLNFSDECLKETKPHVLYI